MNHSVTSLFPDGTGSLLGKPVPTRPGGKHIYDQSDSPYADLISQLQRAAEEDWEMAMPTEIAYKDALNSPDAEE